MEEEENEDEKGPIILKSKVEKTRNDMTRKKVDLMKELGTQGWKKLNQLISRILERRQIIFFMHYDTPEKELASQ